MPVELLVFEVEQGRFAFHASVVREVVRAASLTPVPAAPETIDGMLNLRGRVIPVINLRAVFRFSSRDIEHTDHMIVTEIDGHAAAFRVDRASVLISVDENVLQDVAPDDPAHRYVSHFAQSSVGLVSVINRKSFIEMIKRIVADGIRPSHEVQESLE